MTRKAGRTTSADEALLEVDGLSLDVATPNGPLAIVGDVSFRVPRGGAIGIVGESGAGKSLLVAAALRLLPDGVTSTARALRFDGRDLLRASERELSGWRGAAIGFVPQEPSSAMNPVLSVGAHVAEPLRLHGTSRGEAKARAIAWMEKVGLSDAAALFDRYPHELSGGMKQRALLAAALVSEPTLLVADEPTAMLDAGTREDVVRVLEAERARRSMAVLLVSHDLERVARLCDRALVMYAGEVVEETSSILGAPRHPYTRGLVGCLPRGRAAARQARLPGEAPPFAALPTGCRFGPRCERRATACDAHPRLEERGREAVRCFVPYEHEELP